MYGEDKIWVGAKKLAKLEGRQNDWTTVITIYNESKGKHVRLYVLDAHDNYYRVLANTDKGNTLVMTASGHVPSLIPTEDVISFKKFFDFVDSDKVVEKTISSFEPIHGKNSIMYSE